MTRRDRLEHACWQHALAGATCPTPSHDGTVVYVVCTCGARRPVAADVWQAEEARRAVAPPASEGALTLPH